MCEKKDKWLEQLKQLNSNDTSNRIVTALATAVSNSSADAADSRSPSEDAEGDPSSSGDEEEEVALAACAEVGELRDEEEDIVEEEEYVSSLK